jgi:hypothetical protein
MEGSCDQKLEIKIIKWSHKGPVNPIECFKNQKEADFRKNLSKKLVEYFPLNPV